MNQTQDPTSGAPAGEYPDESASRPRSEGPRVTRDEVFDIERLRRSSSDKYVAGVAGGLGRHLDIDPLIVRVVFAVTSLFGVGILLYAALWLLLPDEQNRAAVVTSPETRKVLVILAAALAGAMLLGAVFGDRWGIFPLALLALGGVAIFATLRTKEPRSQRPTDPGSTYPHPGHQDPAYYRRNPEPAAGDDVEHTIPYESGGPAGAAASTPWTYAPPPPRRPRRTGPILFWPTLAVLAIALGSLAMYDIGNPVADGAYAALSLGVVGVALVIGAFYGRAGGLILLGLMALPPLLITSAVGNNVTQSSGQVTERPTRAADVRDAYDVRSGRLQLDLTAMTPAELTQLDGRVITIDMSAGEVAVTLPEGVGHDVEADLRFAGEVRIFERISSGLNPSLDSSAHRSGKPTISLDIDGTVGVVEVSQEGLLR